MKNSKKPSKYTIEFTPHTHWWYRWHYIVKDKDNNTIVWSYCHTKSSGRREAKRAVWWRTKSWFRKRENNLPSSKENL